MSSLLSHLSTEAASFGAMDFLMIGTIAETQIALRSRAKQPCEKQKPHGDRLGKSKLFPCPSPATAFCTKTNTSSP